MFSRNTRASALLPDAIRYASFGIGLLTSLCLMLFPFLLHNVPAERLHAGLPLAMLGVAGTFVHGIGYRPDNRLVRVLFAPLSAWLLIALGTLLLLR